MFKNTLILILITVLCSCGGGGGGTSEKSSEQLRFINVLKSESALDIQFGDDVLIEELAYGESSGYVEVQEGKVQLRISSAERVVPILSAEQTIKSAAKTTLIVLEDASKVAIQSVEEKPVAPLSGESSVRIGNFSEDKQSVDVYFVFPGDSLKDQIPATTELAFKSFSTYISFPSGTFDIVYAEAGTKNIIRRASNVTFAVGKNYTHILLDQIGAAVGQTSRLYEDSLF